MEVKYPIIWACMEHLPALRCQSTTEEHRLHALCAGLGHHAFTAAWCDGDFFFFNVPPTLDCIPWSSNAAISMLAERARHDSHRLREGANRQAVDPRLCSTVIHWPQTPAHLHPPELLVTVIFSLPNPVVTWCLYATASWNPKHG